MINSTVKSNDMNEAISERIEQDFMINILMRNTYRPMAFAKCINSILTQTYKNFKIIMCYDDDRCLEYLRKYEDNKRIDIFKTNNIDKTLPKFYNLYCNQLLEKVDKGWIIFLDDDDMFATNDALQTIASRLYTQDHMLFWKFKRPDREIYPDKRVLPDSVASCGYCFHTKHKNLSRWTITQGGDFNYIEGLLRRKDFSLRFINSVLTKTTFNAVKPGNYGAKEDTNRLYVKLLGGLGNQLFMLFNAISLSELYNKNLIVDFDNAYSVEYLKKHNVIRRPGNEYAMFQNFSISTPDTTKFIKVSENEKDLRFKKINLDDSSDYILNGYYQSYKYFYQYKDVVKEYIQIDEEKVSKTREALGIYNKKILAIHMRLGDFVKLSDVHYVQPLEYYRKALSFYNLTQYQIILFSDDIPAARNKLAPLGIDYLCANNIVDNDEEEFLLLSLCNVRICANSTYSLMSCYMNEIYDFVKDCEYILPRKWFGPKGPTHDVNDYCLNYKFYVMDIEPEEKKYDVVTTLHSKDSVRYDRYLRYNRKFLRNADNFYYYFQRRLSY